MWHNWALFAHKKKTANPLYFKRFACILKRFEPVYKPSSVVYGHLSRLTVTDKLKRYSRYSVGRTALLTETQSCSEWGLHGTLCYQSVGELLPRLSILTVSRRLINKHSSPKRASNLRRFISVALSRRSLSPDVIRHPVLCSSDFPHGFSAPRPYNKLKSIYIIALFFKKCTLFSCFLKKKGVKYY